MQCFPGYWPGSLSNVQPDSNVSVENAQFLNFSPSIKSNFVPDVKVVVGTDFIFCKTLLHVIINIYDDYSISDKWPCDGH